LKTKHPSTPPKSNTSPFFGSLLRTPNPEMHRISLVRLSLDGAFDLHSFPLLLSAPAVECAFSLDAGEETDAEVE
jgi:hypothetical protein